MCETVSICRNQTSICHTIQRPTGEFYLADPTLTVKNGWIQLSCYSHVKIRPEPPWS